MFRIWSIFLLVFGSSLATPSLALDGSERMAILDAARPVAAKKAGQAVKIKVEQIKQDGDWAMLIGGLVGAEKPMNWQLAKGCEPELDKMLWVMLQRNTQANQEWQVKRIDICASEPPYWYIKENGGFVPACGVYAGLSSGEGQDLQQQCEKVMARQAKSKR